MSNELALKMESGLVQCGTVKEALDFCRVILNTGLAPKTLDTPEKILLCVQLGAELGMKPMTAIQNIGVVNGKPAVYGKAVMGVIESRGVLTGWKEWFTGTGDNLAAFCWVKRGDIERTGEFSWQDAKRAGLTNKDTYQKFPKDMCMYRARARATALFADCLCGLGVVEDLQDIGRSVKEPKDVETIDPLLASPVATEKVDVAQAAAETTGDAELYKDYLKRFDECGDLKSAKEVAKSILDAKMNNLLSEDQLADLRQKREEVENNLKGVKS